MWTSSLNGPYWTFFNVKLIWNSLQKFMFTKTVKFLNSKFKNHLTIVDFKNEIFKLFGHFLCSTKSDNNHSNVKFYFLKNFWLHCNNFFIIQKSQLSSNSALMSLSNNTFETWKSEYKRSTGSKHRNPLKSLRTKNVKKRSRKKSVIIIALTFATWWVCDELGLNLSWNVSAFFCYARFW